MITPPNSKTKKEKYAEKRSVSLNECIQSSSAIFFARVNFDERSSLEKRHTYVSGIIPSSQKLLQVGGCEKKNTR